MHRFYLVVLPVLVFSFGCVSQFPAPAENVLAKPFTAGLPAAVTNALGVAGIPADALGAIVIRVSDGATIISHRADASMQPASTMKLLTAIVGLERLGPTYRGRAELRSAANIVDGVLEGDLILRGLGDPDLDWMALRRMLQTLRNKGIREIRGDLIVDRHMFNPSRYDIGIPPFDESPEFRYNVIPDALLLNTNLQQFTLVSDDANLTIHSIPELDGVSVNSNLKLIERACDQWEEGWQIPTLRRKDENAIEIVFSGNYPVNCSTTIEINVLDRIDFADRMFKSLWHEVGGKWQGRARENSRESALHNRGIPPSKVLAEHRSRTLAEVTRDIEKRSDNPITRLLYLTLGTIGETVNGQDASALTTVNAEKVVRSWLEQQGIADDGLVLENGSGLSRIERIRPRQLASILHAAYRSNWAPEFQSNLPIVGVDGGMEKRLRDSPAAMRGRIKTGTLRNVTAVAGFVPDSTGRLYIVVAIINYERSAGSLGAIARPVVDALIDWVARVADLKKGG